MIRRLSILIVEDNYVYATQLAEKLNEIGYTDCTIASSQQEALDAVHSTRIDMVMLDISLEGNDKHDIQGIEVGESIRKQLQVPIIFLTRHDDPRIFQSALGITPDGYLVKGKEDDPAKLEREISLSLERYWQISKTKALIYNTAHQTVCFRATRQNVSLNGETVKLDGWLKIDVEKVIMVEADGNYCRVFYLNDRGDSSESIYVSGILKEYAKQLKLLKIHNLVRCNRSCIVNLHFLKFINSDHKYLLLNSIKKPIVIGNSYKDQILAGLSMIQTRNL